MKRFGITMAAALLTIGVSGTAFGQAQPGQPGGAQAGIDIAVLSENNPAAHNPVNLASAATVAAATSIPLRCAPST